MARKRKNCATMNRLAKDNGTVRLDICSRSTAVPTTILMAKASSPPGGAPTSS